jgi:Secretion system C-terminal sorting domain/CARDB
MTMKYVSKAKFILVLLWSVTCLNLSAQVAVPYLTNFEGAGAITGWSTYALSGIDDWEIGDPSGTYFNSPYSDDSAWVTTLNGTYISNSVRCLETPEFDLTNTLVDYAFTFVNKRHETGSGTQWEVEYSTDGGSIWSILYDVAAEKKGWQGSSGFTYNVETYFQESSISLSWLQGQNVKFRFKFTSTNGAGDGWLIDDFSIKEAEYNVIAYQGDTIYGMNKLFTQYNVVSPWSFENQYASSYPYEIKYYFSEDVILDVSDSLLGTFSGTVSGGDYFNYNKTFNLQPNLNSGYYYIIYNLDSQDSIAEVNELDNVNYVVLSIDSIYAGTFASDFDTTYYAMSKTNLGSNFDWKKGDANNWHIENPRSGTYAWMSPEYTLVPQYCETPYIDLSTTTNTSVCLWFRTMDVQNTTISLNYTTPGQSVTTFPVYGSSTAIADPRLYQWDCFCDNISFLDGELSTKVKISGTTNNGYNGNQMIIDDIYIGVSKPDAAIEGFKTDRFTPSDIITDTIFYYYFNSGLIALPSADTEFYWSTDSILDVGDIFLGSKLESAMADTSFEFTWYEYAKPTTASGTFYIFYIVDAGGTIDEMREYDNSGYFEIHQEAPQTLPYYNDFETQIDGWRHSSSLGQDEWEWAIPQGSIIDTAFSGVRAWVTNDTGIVSPMSRMHLFTPVFDLTELVHPVLEFDIININYGIGQYATWPFNMGDIMYSTDGGASWLEVDTTNLSFKRMYYRMMFESNAGLDQFPLNGTGHYVGTLLYGKELKMFRNQIDYQTRDYNDNTHFVVDLDYLGDFEQIQFMFVHANHDSPMEGMMMDNFEITEARTDLTIKTDKILMVDKDDTRLKFFFKLDNDENYISSPTAVNIYLSIDTILTLADSLMHTEQFGDIRPFRKELAIIDVSTPGNYSDYNYVLFEIDPLNIVVESIESNNLYFLPLGMDSCENYIYPISFDFEDEYINGWTWYSDSSEFYNNIRFRTRTVINDPAIGAQNGEWFCDPKGLYSEGTNTSSISILILESPAFDFTAYTNIEMTFDFLCVGDNSSSGWGTQGGNMEYSDDGGFTWQLLTTVQDPFAVNWYNLNQIESLNDEPGWGNSPGPLTWLSAEYDLSFLAGSSTIRFRYKFKSDEWDDGYQEGFRLDNFIINATQSDLKTSQSFLPVLADIWQINFPVSYEIINNSGYYLSGTTTKMYWSKDSIYDIGDSEIYNFTEITIPADSTIYINMNIDYPIPVVQLNYWLFYEIDATNIVTESIETNNLGSFKVTFNDTSLVDLSINPSVGLVTTLVSIPSIQVSYDLYNNGNSESGISTSSFYWSTDSIYDIADQFLSDVMEVSVGASNSEFNSISLTYPLPIVLPQYYVIIKADRFDNVIESNELNNQTYVNVIFGDLNVSDQYSINYTVWYNDNYIYINSNGEPLNSGQLGIYNVIGQEIDWLTFNQSDSKTAEIQVANLPAGLYLIILTTDNEHSIVKFIIE